MTFEIDNIDLNFDRKNILNAVYLKAETGKITAILGRNGSGKSSLMKIIFGNLHPHQKLLRIDKKPILKDLFLTGKVKFLTQQTFIPNHLLLDKVFDLYGVEWEGFLHHFKDFSKYKYSRINLLSGGEKRILQAYLIIKSPCELLLLDEPFSHISPIYVEQFKKLINIEKQHKAIILTDHLYREVLEIADDLYLLKHGTSRLLETKEELSFHNYLVPWGPKDSSLFKNKRNLIFHAKDGKD